MKRDNKDANKGVAKKKLAIDRKGDADCSSDPKSSTRLEDLSNEIIYEIWDYLDAFHIYQAFSSLNQRFFHLLMSPMFPLKFNITSLSKSNFHDYSRHFITPHRHQVMSLCMRNALSYDLDISPHRFLSTFPRLETLILEHLDPKHIDDVMEGVASLSNLSTLILIIEGDAQNGTELLLRVFRLSTLKYFKLCSYGWSRTERLPFASNEHSNIEHLTLKSSVECHEPDRLLSYVPRLRRFSIKSLVKINSDNEFQPSFPSTHLTHVILKLSSDTFDAFERLMKSFFSTIEVLHLEVWNHKVFFDARRWEQLITSSLPRLRIFDLFVNGGELTADDSRIAQFNSSFWNQRQWYFVHERVLNQFGCYVTNLFSVAPYRRREYAIKGPVTVPSYLDDQSKCQNSVRHVHIYKTELLHDYPLYFPHANDLFIESKILPMTDLKRIVVLQNVTKLTITFLQVSWEQLLEILLETPNLIILSTQKTVMNSKKLKIVEQTENFQSVANRNIIREFTMWSVNDEEGLKTIFSLFPHLECFTINFNTRRTATIIRTLFWTSNSLGRSLNFLTIGTDDEAYLRRIVNFTGEGQFLAGFSCHTEYRRLRLWR